MNYFKNKSNDFHDFHLVSVWRDDVTYHDFIFECSKCKIRTRITNTLKYRLFEDRNFYYFVPGLQITGLQISKFNNPPVSCEEMLIRDIIL
jgi:hypothetical protein